MSYDEQIAACESGDLASTVGFERHAQSTNGCRPARTSCGQLGHLGNLVAR
jgi:hypothetical protein